MPAGSLLFLSPHAIDHLARTLTAHELSQDPHDLIARYMLHTTGHLSSGTTLFGAVYLLSHGIAKVVLVALVLRDKLWAYPWLIALLRPSSATSSTDHRRALLRRADRADRVRVALVWLTWREYRSRRALRHQSGNPVPSVTNTSEYGDAYYGRQVGCLAALRTVTSPAIGVTVDQRETTPFWALQTERDKAGGQFPGAGSGLIAGARSTRRSFGVSARSRSGSLNP